VCFFLVCTVLCVASQAVELTSTNPTTADCRCGRCGAPMCRRLCQLDCLRCCKCCVYFDLRMGRRSAANTDAVVGDVHPHHDEPGPAAGMVALYKRSRRRLSVSTVLSLTLVTATRYGPHLIARVETWPNNNLFHALIYSTNTFVKQPAAKILS